MALAVAWADAEVNEFTVELAIKPPEASPELFERKALAPPLLREALTLCRIVIRASERLPGPPQEDYPQNAAYHILQMNA